MNEDKDRFLLDRRYVTALGDMSDDTLGALAAALDGELRDAFAQLVGLPEGAFDDVATLGERVRDGYTRRRVAHDTGVILAEPCTQYSIEKLGDSSEDPSVEELRSLLPEVTEKFGADAVLLMVIQYSRSLRGFRELVASDDRFAPKGDPVGGTLLVKDEAEQAAKREARKARKAAKKK
jgi:hypothetical protein